MSTLSGGHADHLTNSSREQQNGVCLVAGGIGSGGSSSGSSSGKTIRELSKHQLICNGSLHQQMAGNVQAHNQTSAHIHPHTDLDPRLINGGHHGGPPPPKVETMGMIDAWARMPPQYASQATPIDPQFINSSRAAYYHAQQVSPYRAAYPRLANESTHGAASWSNGSDVASYFGYPAPPTSAEFHHPAESMSIAGLFGNAYPAGTYGAPSTYGYSPFTPTHTAPGPAVSQDFSGWGATTARDLLDRGGHQKNPYGDYYSYDLIGAAPNIIAPSGTPLELSSAAPLTLNCDERVKRLGNRMENISIAPMGQNVVFTRESEPVDHLVVVAQSRPSKPCSVPIEEQPALSRDNERVGDIRVDQQHLFGRVETEHEPAAYSHQEKPSNEENATRSPGTTPKPRTGPSPNAEAGVIPRNSSSVTLTGVSHAGNSCNTNNTNNSRNNNNNNSRNNNSNKSGDVINASSGKNNSTTLDNRKDTNSIKSINERKDKNSETSSNRDISTPTPSLPTSGKDVAGVNHLDDSETARAETVDKQHEKFTISNCGSSTEVAADNLTDAHKNDADADADADTDADADNESDSKQSLATDTRVDTLQRTDWDWIDEEVKDWSASPPPVVASQHSNDVLSETQDESNATSLQADEPSSSSSTFLLRDLIRKNNYNPEQCVRPEEGARFFVIKSYSEDDVHRSIKYSIWCSTEHGNKKLDQAFRHYRSNNRSIYLFYSVNGSGHFCGMARMTSSVDYETLTGVWAQDKWKGKFNVQWIYVKDIPNPELRHIRLENNENKPVTNSRDTQEIPPEKGRQVLEIMHNYRHKTSLFDDFVYYEDMEQKREAEREIHQASIQTINPASSNYHARDRHSPSTGARTNFRNLSKRKDHVDEVREGPHLGSNANHYRDNYHGKDYHQRNKNEARNFYNSGANATSSNGAVGPSSGNYNNHSHRENNSRSFWYRNEDRGNNHHVGRSFTNFRRNAERDGDYSRDRNERTSFQYRNNYSRNETAHWRS